MPITLSAEAEAKISEFVRQGNYPSAELVILTGLQLLQERQQKAQAWLNWTESHGINLTPPADDSRESLYTREDEAL